MDKLVFDIETKNIFQDVGGRENLKDLDVSVVGVYSYDKNEYICFEEHELPKLGEMMQKSQLLVGFNIKYFDLPVLEKYFKFNIHAIPSFDIFEAVKEALGRRIGLGVLGEANLGIGKTGTGLNASELYKEGKIEELKKYCLQDVKITKEIYELIKNQGYLWIPQRDSPQMTKLEVSYKEITSSQTQLF